MPIITLLCGSRRPAMPFYEYECTDCRYYAEVLQKISDAPLKKCPSCGKNSFKKLVSAPVFRLKGSGWYETDFKSDQEGRRNLVGADKDDSASTKAPDSAKPAASDASGSGTTATGDAAASGKAAAVEKTGNKPATKSAAARGKATAKPAGKAAAKRSVSRPVARKSVKRRGGR